MGWDGTEREAVSVYGKCRKKFAYIALGLEGGFSDA